MKLRSLVAGLLVLVLAAGAADAVPQSISPPIGGVPTTNGTAANLTANTSNCNTPPLSITSPLTPSIAINCLQTTGSLSVSSANNGGNVFELRNTSLNGDAAIGYIGGDPYYPLANYTGSVSGNTLTVSAFGWGIPIAVNQYLLGAGIPVGTYITALGTGTGGAGTYTLSNSMTVASTNITSQLLFEKAGIGWGGYTQPVTFIEASSFDGASDPLLPPAEFDLFQTGGVDPTGGTYATCGVTAGSTTLTCTGNIPGANGNLINATTVGTNLYGVTKTPAQSGIQARATLVSGAGTTSGVMSLPASATVASQTTLFTNPTYAQRAFLRVYKNGPLNFLNIDLTSSIFIDRIGKHVIIGNTVNPLTNLFEVNGTAKVDGAFTTANVSLETCETYATPTTGTTYTLPAGACGATLEPAGTLASLTINLPASPIAGQVAWFSTTQPITALTVSGNGGVIRAGTTPTSLAAGGGFKMIYNANTVWYPHP